MRNVRPWAALLGVATLALACGTPSQGPGLDPTTATSTTSSTGMGGSGQGGFGGQGGVGGKEEGGAPPGCGDGMIVPPEECEGDNLGGKTCKSLNYDSGTLSCKFNCQFNTSKCVKPEDCSNGSDEDLNGLIDCADPGCAAACAESCSVASIIVAPSLPFVIQGTTNGHANKLNATCSSSMGAKSGPEIVYQITPIISGVLELTLTSGENFGISVKSECEQPAELGCSEEAAQNAVERLKVPVIMGQKVFVVVQGYAPSDEGFFILEAKNHAVVCGDASADDVEECDDGNAVSGDGCSAQCALEPTETEPNGSKAQADAYGSPFYASIGPLGDVDFVSVVVASTPASITATVDDFDGHSCEDGVLDSYLEIRDTDGVTVLAAADNVNMGSCSAAQVTNLLVGTYYVRVSASPVATQAHRLFPYKLDIAVTQDVCGDGVKTPSEQCDDNNVTAGDGCSPTCLFELTEVEPNGKPMQAKTYSNPWHAAINPAGDVDVIAVVVLDPDSTLSAVVVDFGTGDCQTQAIISTMDVLDVDGSTVLGSNSGNGNYCAGLAVGPLQPGKYYVRIKAGMLAPNKTFPYGLDVTVF